MKSFWSVQYNGYDVEHFLTRLERRLGAPLIDAKHETSGTSPDETWIEFYLDHPADEWKDALFQVLVVAQRLGRSIQLSGDARDMLIGTTVVRADPSVPGLVGCAWRIQANQDYHALEMIQPHGSNQSAAA